MSERVCLNCGESKERHSNNGDCPDEWNLGTKYEPLPVDAPDEPEKHLHPSRRKTKR